MKVICKQGSRKFQIKNNKTSSEESRREKFDVRSPEKDSLSSYKDAEDRKGS